MKAYEFSTCRTPDGKLVIPDNYIGWIPEDTPVRVIVLTEEKANSHKSEDYTYLEAIIKKIRNSRQKPENIQPASGLLAEHLEKSPEILDPLFDPEAWNREWDKIETMIKLDEVAEQQSEIEINKP